MGCKCGYCGLFLNIKHSHLGIAPFNCFISNLILRYRLTFSTRATLRPGEYLPIFEYMRILGEGGLS